MIGAGSLACVLQVQQVLQLRFASNSITNLNGNDESPSRYQTGLGLSFSLKLY
jgi:hypothetical protein